ncbi:MAG: hypothetical protein AAF217_05355 [Pseudomonadota bacterium]
MADYYSILNKTITGLAQNTPQVRQVVYSKARAAIENQLRKMNPVPEEDVIARQLGQLEDAITSLEAEYTPTTIVEDIAPPEPQSVTEIPPAPEEAPPVVSEEIISNPQPEIPTTEESVISTSVPVEVSAEVPVVPEPALTLPEPEAAPQVMTEVPVAPEPSNSQIEPVSTTVSDSIPEPEAVASLDSPIHAPEEKGGILKTLIIVLILLLLIGGAVAWFAKDTLAPIFQPATSTNSDSSGGDQNSEETLETAEDAPADEPVSETTDEATGDEQTAEKEVERLESDQEDAGAATDEEIAAELEATQEPILLSEDGTQSPTPVENEVEAVVEPVEENSETETASQDQAVSTDPSLGESAFLYEEGSGGSSPTRSDASVSWELGQIQPGEGLPNEAIIIGKMSVPANGMSLELSIKRNVDPALSASHLIELNFTVPEGFAGGSIEDISRFVLKPTEDARGEQLVAVPVKVSEGFFLIALDNLDQAVEVNRQLLVQSPWIDIPVSYNTGKRALVTMKKGDKGDQVFKQAFEDWASR